jgi:hypothetical protein
MTNGAKTKVLAIIASIAMVGLLTSLGLAWYGNPSDWTMANQVTLVLKDILLMIIGFLTGSSKPDTDHVRIDGGSDAPKRIEQET